jgi:membrane protein implicated in regulation of membrane protease activity
MQEWWTSLALFDKVIWAIAVPVSVVFIVQTIVTFAGMDSGAGMEADFDGDMSADSHGGAPFQLFTFRNFINFFLGFSWTAIALRSRITNENLLILVSALAGMLLVALVMYLFYAMNKMQQSGTMRIEDAVNKTAEVYLTIPGHKNGMGKIHVKVQGVLRELDALTEGETIPSGAVVKVTGVIEGRVLLVENA